MKRLCSIVVASVLLSNMALCFDSGNDFLRECRPALKERSDLTGLEKVSAPYCLGYVSGFGDGFALGEIENPTVCLPKTGIETGQALRIVIKSMEDNPQDLHRAARILVFRALYDSFPCSRKKR